ncbi:MAG: imidazolonepropionase [Acidobacteria bacterium]|nr:MAG: imidazolonepropionase [Acidobacteriota bacterium]
MLVIENIGELFLPEARLLDAYLSIEGDHIVSFGEGPAPKHNGDTLDAGGGAVIPGLIDAHTHLVFAGTREDEFVHRCAGKSYLEIAKAGGGIQRTVQAVRDASLDELVELALPRLARMLSYGVTTIEVKSGYGLTLRDEIKMLEAVRRLGELQPIELVGTYLAAHTLAPEYRDRRKAYIDLVVSDELMARVAEEGLAEFCDVFCEDSAFTLEESRRVLEKGKEHGLTPKIHADQITQMGASRLAAEVGAITAEHLEHIDEGGIEALAKASVIGGLLPGCSFYLGVAQAPARRLLEAGVRLTVATDYNPGSSVVESLPLTLSIACTQAKMTPEEALTGATANAADALLRGDRIGRIARELQADLVVLETPNVDQWLYQVGRNAVRAVVKKGRIVYERAP